MGDLDKLIAAVEAGAFDADEERKVPKFNAFADAFEAALGMKPSYADGWGAYRGSLDAALRLHEALLPGWEWHLKSWSGMADTPARAWLLAILRALQAQSAPLDEHGPVDPRRRG